MQNTQEKTGQHSGENNEKSTKKKRLISDTKFALMRQYQQVIFDATESLPSIRRIMNEIITEENLQKIATKFIEVWK
ncbi:MAG: hypothetical protein K0R24_1652 [Gammaproteobacteria bacterium]|jgi:hypothetical protein|nr:hypothetical protein [Gammaproteobacteria bacterium]